MFGLFGHTNEIMSIRVYDINSPNKIDTSWVRTYAYSGNEIVKQITKHSNEDSTIMELIENINDSLFVYKETSFHLRRKENKNWKHTTEHRIIKDKNGLKTQWIQYLEERKIITEYEYYPNRRIRRRTITRMPEYQLESVYTGGPGSDDQQWEYKYDKKGRVKILFTIVDGKKYKLAKYKYK